MPTLVLLIIINSTHSYGTNYSEYLRLTSYDKDPEAEAVIIKDIGNSRFIFKDNITDLRFARRTIVKIFRESGIKYSTISIPIYHGIDFSAEKIISFKGVIYNIEKDSVIEIEFSTNNFFIERINSNISYFKIALPNVKVGSVIDYTYEISSPFIFNLQNWYFQSSIPTIYSEYSVDMCPFYKYESIYQGSRKPDEQKCFLSGYTKMAFGVSYKEKIYVYILRNVPAFKDESFITSSTNYLLKINFQLSQKNYPNGNKKTYLTKWEFVIPDLLISKYFGKYVTKCEKIASRYINLDSLKNKPKGSVPFEIVSYLKNNTEWNNGYGIYAYSNPKDVLKERIGNVSEINLMLTGFLRKCNFEAYPVIISTRDNGRVHTDYPFLHYFNYVIVMVKVNNTYIFLDATDKNCFDNDLPLRCFNDKGLIIQKNKVNWAKIKPAGESKTYYKISSILKTDASINSSNIDILYHAYDAYVIRNYLDGSFDKLKEFYFENYNTTIDTSSLNSNLLERNDPLKTSFTINQEFYQTSNKLGFNPFLNLIASVNHFNQTERTFPIDLQYNSEIKYQINIEIPDNYVVNTKPKSISIDNENFYLDYTCEVNDSLISIDYIYKYKKFIYPAEDYFKLKEFNDLVILKGNENIILLKNLE